ncbi:hypothetical protein TSUD_233090 [Trifolium subterraneum]|uniref:Major facilitator superfamily (MFS) profile domain-containing protein n=1 Tax=Trifolium subterraneum TaxID=3900 RepID=A0A2Z6LN66_TRISU|nr:hypothetical protein TSUD_233090 [Trifolium subterraneum]
MDEGFEKMEQNDNVTRRKKGGIITLPFIFASDVCEKLAVVGISTNMINYLTTQLHMPLTKAANTITNFNGTASLTPLLAAIISDSFAGKFITITVASIIYQIGMISLTLSAILPQLRPPPCKGEEVCQVANSGQLTILYLSLLLEAIGSGGIRACAAAFGADQFDDLDPKQTTKTWNYFNWYYFVTGVAMLVSVTVLVYIQDNVGWGWGLGIPTMAMFLSIITFICGYPLYRHLNPKESPFTGLVKVGVAAFRSMYVFTLLSMLFTTALYDRVLISVSRRYTKLDRGISVLHRMGIGLVIAIFATFVAGFIEVKRKKIAMEHGLIEHSNEIIPISVFWLVPQYCLYGMAEAFMSIGHIEFFCGEAPESMASTAMAFYWASISLGNYVSTLLVTLVHKFSAGPDDSRNSLAGDGSDGGGGGVVSGKVVEAGLAAVDETRKSVRAVKENRGKKCNIFT